MPSTSVCRQVVISLFGSSFVDDLGFGVTSDYIPTADLSDQDNRQEYIKHPSKNSKDYHNIGTNVFFPPVGQSTCKEVTGISCHGIGVMVMQLFPHHLLLNPYS
jgi:hypothetical protein